MRRRSSWSKFGAGRPPSRRAAVILRFPWRARTAEKLFISFLSLCRRSRHHLIHAVWANDELCRLRNWNRWKWLPKWIFFCVLFRVYVVCALCASLDAVFLFWQIRVRSKITIKSRIQFIDSNQWVDGCGMEEERSIKCKFIGSVNTRRDDKKKHRRCDNFNIVKAYANAFAVHQLDWINCNGMWLHLRRRCNCVSGASKMHIAHSCWKQQQQPTTKNHYTRWLAIPFPSFRFAGAAAAAASHFRIPDCLMDAPTKD